MSPPLSWAILSTGNIARQFVHGLQGNLRHRIVAVGSRETAAAKNFIGEQKLSADTFAGDYQAAINDSRTQAVYIGLPNSMHHDWTLRALNAGKHVLCEKPIAVTHAQAQEMFDLARQKGLILVEAFMYRSHPLTNLWLQQVRDGAIGQLKFLRSCFCFASTSPQNNIRFDAKLAGGALMDVGCYCVNFSRLLAGQEPSSIHGVARLHPNGVDELTAGTLTFPNGVIASFTCGMTVHADNTSHVCGSDGWLEIPWTWKPQTKGAKLKLSHAIPPRMDGGKPQTQPPTEWSIDAPGTLYGMEADAFAATVLDHAPPAITMQDSLGNMKVLDELRRQIGLAF